MHRILPQGLRIVEVLPTGDQRHHPLAQHRLGRMHDLAALALVVDPTRHSPNQLQLAIDLPRQQQPAVAADLSAREVGLHLPTI